MGFIQRVFKIGDGSTEYQDFLDAIIVSDVESVINDHEEKVIHKMATKLSTMAINTYAERKVVRKRNWHTWNVRPNLNQTASDFLYEFYSKLFKKGEALIVPIDMKSDGDVGFFVADVFDKRDFTLKNRVFRDIQIKDYKIREAKYEHEVIYLRFDRSAFNRFNAKIMDQYGPLLMQMTSFGKKQHSNKFLVRFGTNQNLTKEDKDKIDKTIREFMDANRDSALPITKSIEDFKPVDTSSANKTGSVIDNILKLDRFIEDETNLLFGIPPITADDKASDLEAHLVTACLPYAKRLEDQLKAKLYTRAQLEKGDDVRIIIPSNLLDAELDTKIHTGLYSINDALQHSGRPAIDADWADEHWMTKNYAPIKSMLKDNSERKEEEE